MLYLCSFIIFQCQNLMETATGVRLNDFSNFSKVANSDTEKVNIQVVIQLVLDGVSKLCECRSLASCTENCLLD